MAPPILSVDRQHVRDRAGHLRRSVAASLGREEHVPREHGADAGDLLPLVHARVAWKRTKPTSRTAADTDVVQSTELAARVCKHMLYKIGHEPAEEEVIAHNQTHTSLDAPDCLRSAVYSRVCILVNACMA